MTNKQHVSWELNQRQYPKLYQFSYFSLRKIKEEVLIFSNKIITHKSYKILDMWCGNKPYKFLFQNYQEYIWSDVVPGPFVDVVCDNSNLTFEDNYFDYLICNQVLEHTKEVNKAISEIKRVVKKDWFILVSLPFLYPEHACPWDYRRFTRFGLEEIFKDLEIISIKNDTWYFTTVALFVNFIFTKGAIIRTIFSPFFLIINSIARILEFLLIDVLFEFLQIKKLKFFDSIIENNYKQFTANYILLLKNSKK